MHSHSAMLDLLHNRKLNPKFKLLVILQAGEYSYLEMSPQYHSASSSRPRTSTPFAVELDGLSTLAVWTSGRAKILDFGGSDDFLGGITVSNNNSIIITMIIKNYNFKFFP